MEGAPINIVSSHLFQLSRLFDESISKPRDVWVQNYVSIFDFYSNVFVLIKSADRAIKIYLFEGFF